MYPTNSSDEPVLDGPIVEAPPTPPQKRVYEISGLDFATLEQFYETISTVLIPGARWGHNLDAFNDILRGGFGTPAEGFVIVWRNAEISRQRLGYEETVRQLRLRLRTCHPSWVEDVKKEITIAEKRLGDTVFDWLIEIIRRHCEGGDENDGVVLVLD